MNFLRRLAFLSWLLPPLALAQPAVAVVTTEHVRAELLAHAPQGLAPGQPIWLGLAIRHAPHWHTYWKNPGDSGLATTFVWRLPDGARAGEILWPTPKQLPVGPLMNYGYEGELLLPVALSLPSALSGASLEVHLRADWLVCREICIPESGSFTLRLPVGPAIAGNAGAFEAALARLPVGAPGALARARIDGPALALEVDGLPPALRGQPLGFFPESAGVFEHAVPPSQRWDGARWSATLALSAQRSESPATMAAVLVGAAPTGTAIRFDVAGPWPGPLAAAAPPGTAAPPATAAPPGTGFPPATAAPPGTGFPPATAAPPGTTAPQVADAAVAAPAGALLAAIGLALLGGLLLNLMPCVFPVLSLKIAGLAGARDERHSAVAGGLAYTAGVLASFLGLAAILLALRAGGEQLGWGFQLQSPPFVAALAVLFTLIGLNLAGVFEVRHVLPRGLAAARARHPLADHALTGVLAVAVASPCTAPFMGVALGTALALPAVQALAVFAALGIGMALPYLAATLLPAWACKLPRPGAWMVRFRALLAFPMFATVVWLVWVLGRQVGMDGAAALMAVLVAVAFAVWATAAPGFSRRARFAYGTPAVLILAATLVWAWPGIAAAPSAPTVSAPRADARWQAWSTQAQARGLADNRPVFVDFTAAWCVTCQYNKRAALADPAVLRDFEARNVLLLRADWTRRDDAITRELARLGRSGVPVYAFYAPGSATPMLLPEILRTGDLRRAVARLQSGA